MNVPEIQTFVDSLEPVLGQLIELRNDLIATDRLWPVLDASAKQSIHAIAVTRLDTLKTTLAAIQVP